MDNLGPLDANPTMDKIRSITTQCLSLEAALEELDKLKQSNESKSVILFQETLLDAVIIAMAEELEKLGISA